MIIQLSRQSPEHPAPHRRTLILAICCLSLFIVGIDNTIVNIALPTIERDLHASVSGLQWVVDAYTVVLASLLILAGSMGDRFGRRRTFQTGLALFTLGSLLCSLAPNLGWLVATRAVQAIGGAMLNPVAMSIITNTFTEPAARARAIGVWGGVFGLSLALGPVVGGLLLGWAGWQAIFWINIPVGVAAITLAQRYVPESRAPRPRRLDLVGQGLVIVLLVVVTFTIIGAPQVGWTAPRTIGGFALAAAALVLLTIWESHRDEPLIDPHVFRSAPLSGSVVIAICAFASLAGFLFLNTLYLQDVLGLSPIRAGLSVFPIAAMAAILSPLSGRLVGARGPRPSLILAGMAMFVSALLLTGLDGGLSAPRLIAAYVMFGIGIGLVNAPITTTAVAGMPRSQAGVAAAVATTSRMVGQTLGVAVIGSVVLSSTVGPLRSGLTSASRIGWLIIVGCSLVIVLLGILTTGPRTRRSAVRLADPLATPETRSPISEP